MRPVTEQKQLLRLLLRKRRLEMDRAEKNRLDAAVAGHLQRFAEEHRFSGVLTYVSDDRLEVSTKAFLQFCLQQRIPAAVPFCRPESCEMDFYRITSLSDLRPGYYGLPEPDRERCALFPVERDDILCLVPGLAFTRDGFRLGFGKGFYDRFLPRFPGISVGLCYEGFVESSLPIDDYDLSVDFLLTENGCTAARRQEA